MTNLKEFLSLLNARRKETAPFVSRRRYNYLLGKYNTIKETLTSVGNPLSVPPKFSWVQPHVPKFKELCLMVTYAQTPKIKSYVAWHAHAFAQQGVDVVLIVNTDHPESAAQIGTISSDFSGVCVRENKGFDFGAWSHLMRHIDSHGLDRIYWVNDSLFGPLQMGFFEKMIHAVRSSSSDVVGLTENLTDERHLQSFFLAFNRRILNDQIFRNYIENLLNLPTKAFVIEFYEKQLTRLIETLGFRTEALFSLVGQENPEFTFNYPKALVSVGFPYVKTTLIRDGKDEGLALEFLPEHLPID